MTKKFRIAQKLVSPGRNYQWVFMGFSTNKEEDIVKAFFNIIKDDGAAMQSNLDKNRTGPTSYPFWKNALAQRGIKITPSGILNEVVGEVCITMHENDYFPWGGDDGDITKVTVEVERRAAD